MASGDPVLTPAQQTQQLIDERIAAHAAMANVHHSTGTGTTTTTTGAGGLRQTGSEAVTVAGEPMGEHGARLPTTDVFGVQVGEAPIVLGLTADLPDAA